MPTTLDHLVWASPDLPALVDHVSELLHVTPVDGGTHPGRGTRNYLVGLGPGCYLELVGPDPDQPEPAEPRPFGLDDVHRPTLLTWAVRTDDLDATLAAARAAGYDPGPPAPMRRTRPDGVRLEWRLSPSYGDVRDCDRTVPFVIDWGTSPHPSDGLPEVRLDGLTLRHPDAERVRAACLALDVQTPVSVEAGDPAIGATFASGPTSVTV